MTEGRDTALGAPQGERRTVGLSRGGRVAVGLCGCVVLVAVLSVAGRGYRDGTRLGYAIDGVFGGGGFPRYWTGELRRMERVRYAALSAAFAAGGEGGPALYEPLLGRVSAIVFVEELWTFLYVWAHDRPPEPDTGSGTWSTAGSMVKSRYAVPQAAAFERESQLREHR